MTRVLFFSTSNSCRSQIAEGFARARSEEGVEWLSAGVAAGELNPLAVKVMSEVGVDIASHRSKTLDAMDNLDFDAVIMMCGDAAEQCPFLPDRPAQVNWNLPDPNAIKGDEGTRLPAFRDSRDTIRRLVDGLVDRGYLEALVEAKRCETVILNSISDGILAHDTDRRIFCFNRAAERITGFRREDVIDRKCNEVFDGGFCGGRCLFDGDIPPSDLDVQRQEMEISTKSGERRIAEVTIRPMTVRQGDRMGVLVSFHDLTQERRMARRLGEIHQFSGIVGRDKKMLQIFDLTREVANSKVPVLIQGESGTGKELIAAAIHNESARANRLFVPVNCGALPESLLESELFGHVKGAFTGAIRDKKGRFELADGGTIFLDEIGDVSPAVQVKLLRVLQEGCFEPVGGEKTRRVDVRIVSATNKDIMQEIAADRFREDLYYRLSVVPIFLPPLRERRNDIPLLVEHILKRIIQDANHQPVTAAPETMDILMGYDWPGNVRELQNWLQFSLVKCRGRVIRPEHLPPRHAGTTRRFKRRRRKLDADSVRDALRQSNGNKVEAARLLNVSRATLYRFLNDTDVSL